MTPPILRYACTRPAAFICIVLSLMQCADCAYAQLQLISVQNAIALQDSASGRVLGRFTRPEIDERTLDDVPLVRTSHAGDRRAIHQTWRASEGFEIAVSYSVRSNPERVVIRASARNTSPGAKDPYVLFPFQIERTLDFPKLISFTQSATERPPFERPQPGEGLSAFWSTEDYNLTTCDYEMFAPVAAVTSEDGAIVTGCHFDVPSTFRLHRSGRFELFHHFYMGPEVGSTDDGILAPGKTAKTPYEFFIGRTRSTTWQDVYSNWYAHLERNRPAPTHLAQAVRTRLSVIELLPTDEPNTDAVQPAPDKPGYVRFNEQTPARGLLTPESERGRELLSTLPKNPPQAVVLNLRGQGNGAQIGLKAGALPFSPVHIADAAFINAVQSAVPSCALVCINPHPASPAYQMADVIVAPTDSAQLLQAKLQAASTPLVFGLWPDRQWSEEALAQAIFYGCGVPVWRWKDADKALNPQLSEILSRAQFVRGSPQTGQLEYASDDGAFFATMRNQTGKPSSMKPAFSHLPDEALPKSFELRIWVSGLGNVFAETMTGAQVSKSLQDKVLKEGQIAVLSLTPANQTSKAK
ncbi:MAG: hypothetical protein IT209_05190 [Armatimonadetes bacterium]|nr:hypothetical protein [Armatimonadota bacterium]